MNQFEMINYRWTFYGLDALFSPHQAHIYYYSVDCLFLHCLTIFKFSFSSFSDWRKNEQGFLTDNILVHFQKDFFFLSESYLPQILCSRFYNHYQWKNIGRLLRLNPLLVISFDIFLIPLMLFLLSISHIPLMLFLLSNILFLTCSCDIVKTPHNFFFRIWMISFISPCLKTNYKTTTSWWSY